MKEQVIALLPGETLRIWDEWTATVAAYYDVDRLWNKGFGDWKVEYKYRRGGKTLCTFYAKEGIANLLMTYGKAEREKFESIMATVTPSLQALYENTPTYHDGKWLWIPLNDQFMMADILAMLQIKRKPNRKPSD